MLSLEYIELDFCPNLYIKRVEKFDDIFLILNFKSWLDFHFVCRGYLLQR